MNEKRTILRSHEIESGTPISELLSICDNDSTAIIDLEYPYYGDDHATMHLKWNTLETDEELSNRLITEEALRSRLANTKKNDKISRDERDRKEYDRLKKKFEKGK